MSRELAVNEYAPKKIKQSITGNGNATKEQVSGMLQHILKFQHDSKFLDATDGLAVAVCHSFQRNDAGDSGKSYSGWAAFAKANEKRIS
jgi:crossover junction endodeoxyribonuclease RuvC